MKKIIGLINLAKKDIFFTKSYISLSKFSLFSFIKKNLKNLYLFLLYIIGIIFYILSLKDINALDMKCFNKTGVECYYILAILTFISSFFISISIYLILYKSYHKINLIIICLIYSFLLYIDHNNGIIKHGMFNFLGFIFSTIFLLIIFCFFHFLIYLFKKRNYLLFISLIISISYFFFILKIYKLNHFNCDNWIKGLNESSIDNTSKDFPCKIKIPNPHSCYMGEIGKYFDLTSKYRPTCMDNNILKKEKKNFLNDIKDLNFYKISKKNHFALPLTNSDDINPYDFGNFCYRGIKNFEKYVNKHIIFMDLYIKNRNKYYPNISKPEIEIKFEGQYGKLIINVNKNKTLIKERQKIRKKRKNKVLYNNALVIFFDTLSRAHFFRKLSKTVKFLNQFSKYEEKKEKKNMTIFQYFKYHSLNTYTDPNLNAAYYGAELFGNGTNFGKYFKDNGYIIGRTNTICEKENVVNLKNLKSFTHTRFDHEGSSISCISSFFKGMLVSRGSSLVKRCLFGKDNNQYAFEYLESFWTTYLNQFKMFMINIDVGHEPTGELIGHFDETFYKFLNKFYKNGWFKDTTIIIFSDHGMHINGPLYLFDSQDFFYERTLAVLFLIIPNDKKLYKDNLYEKMKSNQQTLITPFDIYNTLIHIANGEINDNYIENSSSFGDSLFHQFNITERYCESSFYKSQISIKYCNCQVNK